MTRTLIRCLWLPYESVRTVYAGTSEVRLYKNEITDVLQIGKRVSGIGAECAIVFREAKLLMSIRHDHIMPVYDVAMVDGAHDKLLTVIEMIMPFYANGSIFDALERGHRFTVGEAIRITRQALLGLSELHEGHRILHRDIKSANVFIDDTNRARIGDLGLAVAMDPDGTAEAFPASQMYTPPEAHTGRRATRESDIYGMGLILHELLNGPFPYADYTCAMLAERLEKGQSPILPRHLRQGPHVPRRIRSVVSKAAGKDPNDRFASAREMIDALDAAPFVDWRFRVDGEVQCWEGTSNVDPERTPRNAHT